MRKHFSPLVALIACHALAACSGGGAESEATSGADLGNGAGGSGPATTATANGSGTTVNATTAAGTTTAGPAAVNATTTDGTTGGPSTNGAGPATTTSGIDTGSGGAAATANSSAGNSSTDGGVGGDPTTRSDTGGTGGTSTQTSAGGSGGTEPCVVDHGDEIPSLKDYYADHFAMGAAIDTSYNCYAGLLTKHYNSVTCEDQMKFDALQPSEGNFSYGTADGMVNFAINNGMQVRGHALVWHRQTPSWVFSGSSAQVLQRMKTHITNVMQH